MKLFKVGKPATETCKTLQNACGDAAVCHACIFEWFKSSGFCRWAKEWVHCSKLWNICKSLWPGGHTICHNPAIYAVSTAE